MTAVILSFPRAPAAQSIGMNYREEALLRATLRQKMEKANWFRVEEWSKALGKQAVSVQMANYLRVHFSVHSVADIPAHNLPEAIAIVEAMSEACREFNAKIAELNRAFLVEVINAGHPWTNWISRRSDIRAEKRPDWLAKARELGIDGRLTQ